MEDKKIIIDRIGKVLILFGSIFLITYFFIRFYNVFNETSTQFYGVGLTSPDRFLQISLISFFIIIIGFIICLLNKRYKKTKI